MSVSASPYVDKKEAERCVLIEAHKAGAPIPDGEVAGEEPDFRFQNASGALGVEVSEIMRPASSNHGILPAEAEAFHQGIIRKAEERFRMNSNLPTHVNVYFSNPRGQKQNKQQLVNRLVEAVQHNRHRANPAVVLQGEELPEGFDHILITDGPSEWWCGEGGGIHLSEIYPEIAARSLRESAGATGPRQPAALRGPLAAVVQPCNRRPQRTNPCRNRRMEIPF